MYLSCSPPAEKLARAVRIKTVSHADYRAIDLDEYRKMPRFFSDNFPLLMNTAEITVLNDFAYIFYWKGPDGGLPPGLLLAHFDVVPADPTGWSVPPFEGRVENGAVWGRGALDTKCTLVGILEAAERLIEQGFQPKRSWYFASGGDEETFGIEGARKMAAYFQEKGIYFDFVLDEGAFVASGMFSDIQAPLALLGISEKGYADIVLRAEGKGGHASMPPKHNPATELTDAVGRIERGRKKRRITYTVKRFLHALVPHVSFLKGIVYANIWLFGPIIKHVMAGNSQSRALIETTTALTMLDAGESENVIPVSARAVYNVRILPGETVAGVCKRFEKLIRNKRVAVSVLDEREVNDPVWETSFDDELSSRIEAVIRSVFPDAVIAPFMSTVTTDSKYYQHVTDRIYRFVPMLLTPEQMKCIHGVDERISEENLGNILHFYTALFQTLS
jgi:carboxypeptidase PM20D1